MPSPDDNSHVRSEDWLQAANQAGFGIVLLTPAGGRILAANPAFVAMHGYRSKEDMIGKTLEEFAVKGSRKLLRISSEAASLRAVEIYESLHVREDGTTFA